MAEDSQLPKANSISATVDNYKTTPGTRTYNIVK